MSDVTRYNTESSYPEEVDSLLWLNDVSIEQQPIAQAHRELLENKHYTDAGEFIENASIDSMCASLFNLLENRIYATQYAFTNKHTKWYEEYGVESPIECFDEPEDKTKKPVWTNIEYLSRVNIGGLSGGYTLSNAGGFRP